MYRNALIQEKNTPYYKELLFDIIRWEDLEKNGKTKKVNAPFLVDQVSLSILKHLKNRLIMTMILESQFVGHNFSLHRIV